MERFGNKRFFFYCNDYWNFKGGMHSRVKQMEKRINREIEEKEGLDCCKPDYTGTSVCVG